MLCVSPKRDNQIKPYQVSVEFAALGVRTERARGSLAEPTVPGECEGGVYTPTWPQEMRFPSSTGRLLSGSPVKALRSENRRRGSQGPALP